MFATLTCMAVLLLQTAPAVPADWSALWLAGTGALTTALTELLKKAAAPLANAPDMVKAALAFVISLVSVKGSVILGVPIPPTLAGFAGVLVTWASSMGVHALAKKLGVIPASLAPSP